MDVEGGGRLGKRLVPLSNIARKRIGGAGVGQGLGRLDALGYRQGEPESLRLSRGQVRERQHSLQLGDQLGLKRGGSGRSPGLDVGEQVCRGIADYGSPYREKSGMGRAQRSRIGDHIGSDRAEGSQYELDERQRPSGYV